jgi:uncharacterized MnhB-related membrane protein
MIEYLLGAPDGAITTGVVLGDLLCGAVLGYVAAARLADHRGPF